MRLGSATKSYDWVAGWVLGAAYAALLLTTAPDLALSRDESFYYRASTGYAAWFDQLIQDPEQALEQATIDRHWSYNREHPGLMKSLAAISWQLHTGRFWASAAQAQWLPDALREYAASLRDAPKEERWIQRPSTALRLPAILLSSLLIAMTCFFGVRAYGPAAGAFAALLLGLMPRLFYHAHLHAFDIPIAAWMTLTTFAYWKSLHRPQWSWLVGIAFGLALSTKHNSWVLPGIFLIHWLWTVLQVHVASRYGHASEVTITPWWLLSMLTLGPLIFFSTWPWIWNETFERIGWYVNFHLEHDYYNVAYLGFTYFEPPFPIEFPFVMTWYTVPLTTLLLAAIGLGVRAGHLVPPGLRRWLAAHWQPTDDRCTDVLVFGCLLAPMLTIALPSTPIFGGTKHWMTAYPFLCLFAGAGLSWLVRRLTELSPRLPYRASQWLAVPIGLIFVMPSAVDTARTHPYGVAYYAWIVGGAPGAATDGMKRLFWGHTSGNLAAWLERKLPEGGTVWIGDTTPDAWAVMQMDGMLPENIRATSSMASADLVLVDHEHHWAEVDYQAWLMFGSPAPVHVLTYEGVPLISVYENPQSKRTVAVSK